MGDYVVIRYVQGLLMRYRYALAFNPAVGRCHGHHGQRFVPPVWPHSVEFPWEREAFPRIVRYDHEPETVPFPLAIKE